MMSMKVSSGTEIMLMASQTSQQPMADKQRRQIQALDRKGVRCKGLKRLSMHRPRCSGTTKDVEAPWADSKLLEFHSVAAPIRVQLLVAALATPGAQAVFQ
jgi:hypothetical protein